MMPHEQYEEVFYSCFLLLFIYIGRVGTVGAIWVKIQNGGGLENVLDPQYTKWYVVNR